MIEVLEPELDLGIELDLSHATYRDMIEDLDKVWTPHSGQIPVGKAIFEQLFHSVFVRCGRKWGKTEIAIYILWRIAKTYPGVPCYYIAPLQTQAREIVWSDPRVKNFGPAEWLLPGSQGINETEMRLRMTNGSFIKIDGSDNYNKYRGPRYKVCIYEEFKDHRPEFRKAMNPNASVLEGINVYVGSPPESECDYNTIDEEHQNDADKFHYHAPTWQNPHISRKWLQDEKTGLYKRGEGDVWEREYAALFVSGGSSKIFPMLNKSIVKPHDEVMKLVHRDRKKLHWFVWSDPAGASCFAVLFVAINPYSKQVYVLDEIYEKDQGEMTVARIGRRIIQTRNELYERETNWTMGYDEAETWFLNEWIDNFPDEEGLQSSHKAANDKLVGLSLIKDILLKNLMVISSRCNKFYWELDHYIKDKKGKVPKKDDHLIDDFRYILASEGYSLKDEFEYIEQQDEDWRGSRIEDDFPSLRGDSFSSDNWEEYN